MSTGTGIVIESERPGTIADHDLYLFRVVEPHVTGNFATLVHMRIDGGWRLIWYPNVSSNRLKSFAVASKEKGFRRVERWAALHGASLPPQERGGHCRFSTYETRRL